MEKYEETIEKLTVGQKLALVTGRLTEAEGAEAGIPCVRAAQLTDAEQGGIEYPSPAAAANSWNAELVGQTAEELALRAKEKGINALVTPPANVKGNLYVEGASEDPVLAGVLAGAYASSALKAGIMPCMPCCALRETEIEYADTLVNQRALREYYLKPFEIAAFAAEGGAIVTSRAVLKGEYADVNGTLVHRWLCEELGREKFLLCDGTDAKAAVLGLRAGYALCIGASSAALETALQYDAELKSAVEKETVSLGTLETARREGTAFPLEKLNEAAARTIDFALVCDKLQAAEKTDGEKKNAEEIALRLAEEAVVLLKNEGGILPLKAGSRVAVIGRAAAASRGGEASFTQYLEAEGEAVGFRCVGYADGYAADGDRNDELILEACELAAAADAALVFVSPDKRREKAASARCVKLPPNQLALLDAFAALRKKVVVVALDDGQTDAGFDKNCAALLLAPPPCTYGARALANLLTGRSNPSGKLAATRYDGADEIFARLRRCKCLGKNKVGTFVGYRHYDTSQIKVRYPFGFGLSYTQFEYSSLRESKEEVRFTVKNTGAAAGAEIVQVYIGKSDSDTVRPLKELKGFTKVYLEAGESAEVCVGLGSAAFEIYDENGKPVTEQGYYQVYVGASVSDIRLTGKIFVWGEKLPKKKEALADYLQTKSNILSGGYTLELPRIRGSRKVGKFALISVIAAALFDVSLFLFSYFTRYEEYSEGLDTFLDVCLVVFMLINAEAVVALVILLVDRLKARKRNKEALAEQKAEFLAQMEEERAEETPYEDLFIEEFSLLPEEERPAPPEKKEEAYYADEETTMRLACERFSAFAAERGLAVGLSAARAVFSAMSASRLVVLKSRDRALLPALVSALGEYFGGTAFIADAAGYGGMDDVLICRKENGTYEETAVAKALNAAAKSASRAHVVLLEDVNPSRAQEWAAPLAAYAASPEKSGFLAPKDKRFADRSYPLSPNLWFFVSPTEGAETLPTAVAETTFVVEADLSATETNGEKSPFKALSYPQFMRLGAESASRFMLSEEKWKKIDRLESCVNRSTGGAYHIGNKAWRSMERFVGTFLACGGEENEALDGVVAAGLLPEILSVLPDTPEGEPPFAHTLENIFGDDESAQCRRMVEKFAAASAR